MNGGKLRFTGMISQNKKGEYWVQNPVSGHYHQMDEIGGSICRLLKNPLSFDALVQALMAEYDVDQPRCEGDVRTFLEKLMENGLVKEVLE